MRDKKVIVHMYTMDMVCPYCGYEDLDSWEHDHDSGEADCLDCGKHYSYQREVSTTYCTYKKK